MSEHGSPSRTVQDPAQGVGENNTLLAPQPHFTLHPDLQDLEMSSYLKHKPEYPRESKTAEKILMLLGVQSARP